jgi:uncharacterized protein Yka (UPF0111/DUF47 family)
VTRRWRRLLLPAVPDVLALLITQGELVVTGMDAFSTWSDHGGAEAAAAVRAAQHDAFRARRALLAALQAALSTPVDQEDLYALCERVDRILTKARDTLREAEVLRHAPDAHTAKMAGRLATATRDLVKGFELLAANPAESGRRADAASDAVRRVEHDYRKAMAELLHSDDLRAVLAAQSIYSRYLEVADAVIAVADRLWFVVLRGA